MGARWTPYKAQKQRFQQMDNLMLRVRNYIAEFEDECDKRGEMEEVVAGARVIGEYVETVAGSIKGLFIMFQQWSPKHESANSNPIGPDSGERPVRSCEGDATGGSGKLPAEPGAD